MLREVGFDMNRPDPLLGWSVFKQFVREPVQVYDDGVLFEVIAVEQDQQEVFSMSFTRQFSHVGADGEYSHMEQLHLGFPSPLTETLRGLETNLWAYDFPTLDAYFAAVEQLPEFQAAIAIPQPWRCLLCQDEV